MIKFIKYLKVFDNLNFKYLIITIFLMQIFLRIILFTFLFCFLQNKKESQNAQKSGGLLFFSLFFIK